MLFITPEPIKRNPPPPPLQKPFNFDAVQMLEAPEEAQLSASWDCSLNAQLRTEFAFRKSSFPKRAYTCPESRKYHWPRRKC